MLKIVSYYKDVADRTKYHFLDWIEKIGEALPEQMGEATLVPLNSNYYDIVDGDFDLAYCPMFHFPNKRPDCFVYSFLSDYKGYESKVKDWIVKVKPNLLCMLQEMPCGLIDFAKWQGCKVVLLPWFVNNNPKYEEKTVLGFSGGRIKPAHYPKRKAIYDYLLVKQFEGVVLSGSNKFGNYQYTGQAYLDLLKKVKYYFSGGIYDVLIPPKYYEAANYGCTMVSYDMPYMYQFGFIDGETYIKLNKLEDIDEIIKSDAYLEIGKNAQKMVQEQHTVKVRAKQLLDVYNAIK